LSRWLAIPAPLARLFNRFPLVVYTPNELPARSPTNCRDLPTLYVFATAHDALKGLPSFNPACLKWQVCALRLTAVAVAYFSLTGGARRPSSSSQASTSASSPLIITPPPLAPCPS
jgi:metaxin